MKLDAAYWQNRYESGSTGWDAGTPTTPLVTYIDQLENKELRILIPGAGNGYEVEYLHNKGFKNVFVVDLASIPLETLANRIPDFPKDHLICGDFFELKDSFDLIIEQTFFCAIDPLLRERYVQKMHDLLVDGGKLVGLLWSVPMNEDTPPFGGSKPEYERLFQSSFIIRYLDHCYNSIQPRKGRELFFLLIK